MHQFERLLRDPVFSFFHEICAIPHPSGQEAALAAHLANQAREQGLDASLDAAGNVLIRKPAASEQQRSMPTVMLQAHLDMVCVSQPGSTHDFCRDPIPWALDGDRLSSGGETSLGADNGIGVALALSMLALDDPRIPPLEVLFTVMEEEDLSGAARFDMSRTNAELLLNLDHNREHEILFGSCGGMRTDFLLPLKPEPVPDGWQSGTLSISGLKGGHSGDDIHRGHGNAIGLLGRALACVRDVSPIRLADLAGGSMRLAIPRDASARIFYPAERKKDIQRAVAALARTLYTECPGCETVFDADQDLYKEAVLLPLQHADSRAPSESQSCFLPDAVISALTLMPDGILQMSQSVEHLVDVSCNLGEARMEGPTLHLVLEIRSAHESQRFEIYRRISGLAALLGGACSYSSEYPGWIEPRDTDLVELCSRVHEDFFGTSPVLLRVHAGLEIGSLCRQKPELRAVSIGPDLFDLHATTESVSISSVRRFSRYLQEVLIRIGESR